MLEIDDPLQRFAIILGAAAVFGLAGNVLRQPLIVAFIAVGIVVGPAVLDVASGSELELLATIGIALLLFVVGLKLDLHVIGSLGKVALLTGLGQVAFTSVIGFGIAIALGFDAAESTYIAVALTFSSTIIIVKLLSDKREIDSLHGRIAVGFLIVQDIVVVITMIAITAIGSEGGNGALREGILVLVKGLGLLASIGLLMRFVIPRVLPVIARSSELLVLTSIAWAVALSVIAHELELSKEIGAFLGGFSLASTPFREAISTRLTSVRDFLLLFFFVQLGANLDFDGARQHLVAAGLLSVFVLVGNPLIVVAIMGAMGYRRRTGFLAGLAVAQISEFSLIFVALGVSLGHVDDDVLGLVTIVGLVTIGVSTYMILYSHQLFERISPWLAVFERSSHHPEDEMGEDVSTCDVIVFGLGRYGSAIARGLMDQGKTVLGIDFDPEVVRRWQEAGMRVHYGDVEDPEFIRHLPLQQARDVISTAPEADSNLALISELSRAGFEGRVTVTARSEEDARRLEAAGAHLVLRPFVDAATRAVEELAT
jgi:Kef-type K+ transport system membrane component KefB